MQEHGSEFTSRGEETQADDDGVDTRCARACEPVRETPEKKKKGKKMPALS